MERYLQPDGWLRYLEPIGELTPEEAGWIGTPAAQFLRENEKTSMVKSYKMPTIRAFLRNGQILPESDVEMIARSWREYYAEPVWGKDMEKDASSWNWRNWDDARLYKLVEQNPIHFLSKSSRFFSYDQIGKRFRLSEEMLPFLVETL